MSFVKGIFGNKKSRREDPMNSPPGGYQKSPSGGATSKSTSSPHYSPQHTSPMPQPNGSHARDDGPTQEEIESMNLPFKEKPASKRDRNLSISRSGRHKYKNKQRMSVLQQDIYSDADMQDAAGAGASPAGYRGVEGHSRQFQSHQRPTLSISGSSAAV